MSRRRSTLILGIIFGLFIWTSSARRTFGATPQPAPPPPTLVSVFIYPPANDFFASDGILPAGAEVPFSATGFYSDGSTLDLTTSATWTSSDTSVATIDTNTGLLTAATTSGTTQITAAFGSVTSGATTITVATNGTLDAIAITPAPGGVTAGNTLQLVAYGNYTIPGATNPWPTVFAELTHEVSWTSSNDSFATVSGAGVVTGVASGTVTITAALGTLKATASVTILPSPSNWASTGDLFDQRAQDAATILNDGTVLLVGGVDSSSIGSAIDFGEIYSPSSGLFTRTTGNMVTGRAFATATLLPDGTVLIAGGGGPGGGAPVATAETYDPTTGLFTATANDMSAVRESATATLLTSGLVLVAGGGNGPTATADLYDPTTRTFTPTGSLNVARMDATATLLQNGDVLIVGGLDANTVLSSAELYNPTTGSFTLLSSTLAFPRAVHTATLLTNGEVLIAGGSSSFTGASTPPAYEELYNPATQTFVQTGALNSPRAGHSATLLEDGTVLLMGGIGPNTLTGLFGQVFPPLSTAEIYNPGTGTFTFTSNMTYARADFTATLLQNGEVLAADGIGNLLFAPAGELYTPASTSPTLVSIAVTPASPSIAKGATQQFTATGTYSDGSTQNVTASVSWASATTTVATITASGGLATGVGAGTSNITASLSGVTSPVDVLTVTAATLQSIAVTPASPSIAKGATQQFTATGTYSDGSTQNVTASVSWASATATVATITASGGLATGVGAGTSNITASLSGVTSPADVLTVTAATLQSIAVTPASPSIAKGATQQFTATGTYSDGSTQNVTASVSWASATTTVATITASGGLATGVGAGTSNITASLSGVTSPADVLTVTAATLQSIAVTPASPSIAKGATQQFTATGTYSDGSTQNITASVSWASATTTVATITASGGLATGVGAGTSNITASLSGVTSPADVLTVTAATLQSIAVTPASPSIAKGATQQFTATGTYSDGSTQNVTASVSWASATATVATITASGGLATGVGAGTSNITASLSGVTSPADVLTVTAATLQSIAVTPASPSIAKGATQQFTATGTYSDGSTQNVTASVSWASATTTVATITASGGLATGVGAGTSNITASLSGVTSPADVLTVTAATLQSIAVTPASPSIAKGATQQFTATGTYSDGSTQNITASVSWTSSNTAVATIVSGGIDSGVASGIMAGGSAITATLSGITSNSATLTVTGGGGSGSTTTHFVIHTPATVDAGDAFNFTVTALDQSGKVATGYSGTVHFTSSDPLAILPPNSKLTNGTGIFRATLKTKGKQTLTATDTANTSITTSNTLVVLEVHDCDREDDDRDGRGADPCAECREDSHQDGSWRQSAPPPCRDRDDDKW